MILSCSQGGEQWLLQAEKGTAGLASDLGVVGEARPVMDGELLSLSRKLFIPAGTSNGLGGDFSDLSGACSNAVRSPGGGAVSPRSCASLLSESAFSRRQLVLEQTILLLHDSLRFSEPSV